MKILFLLTQDLESPSGLGRYWPLARELVHLGHSVTIATLHSNYSSLDQKRFTRSGVEVRYVAPMHVRKQNNVKTYYSPFVLPFVLLRATLALCWAALTIPTDIIHIGKSQPMNGLAGLLGKWFRRRQLWLDCDDVEADINRFASTGQARAVAWFERWLPRQVDFVTTHTQFNRSRLLASGVPAERVYYLSNGVDPARFQSPDPLRIASLRQKYNLEGCQVVAYIGSLSLGGHAINLLLDSFALFHPSHPNIRLLLVGGGDRYDDLLQRAHQLGLDDSVIFVGRVNPLDVVLYYYLSNVSVDPVEADSAARGRSPLKLFESWICGVPFVSADVGDRRSLLGDPPAGVLALPADPTSLADSILQVLDDPALASDLRTRGLARVPAYFWDNLARQLDSFYSSACH